MKSTIGGRVTCGRDAATGRFMPVAKAKTRKKTAIVEKRRVTRLKNGRFAGQR